MHIGGLCSNHESWCMKGPGYLCNYNVYCITAWVTLSISTVYITLLLWQRQVNLVCNSQVAILLVREKISGESREIIGTSIWVALSTRAVKLHHNDWPTPRFISSSRSDVEDRSVDWATLLEQMGWIPDMKGKSQRFAIKALRQDDIPHLVVEMRV